MRILSIPAYANAKMCRVYLNYDSSYVIRSNLKQLYRKFMCIDMSNKALIQRDVSMRCH